MNIIFGNAASRQTDVAPPIEAVGNGLTITVALPACDCKHAVLLPSLTLTRAYVNVPVEVVGTGTVTLLPEVVVTVRLLPLLIV